MDDNWLVRDSTIKLLWVLFVIILAATVLADFFIHPHAFFPLAGTFGFGAWFGFLSCVILILFAKGLGFILKRPDTYYDD